MKRLIFILGVVLIAAGLVASGWWLGFRGRYLTEAYAIPTVDKHLTDAATRALLLHEVDSGHLDYVHHFLRVELEGGILVVDSLLDTSDARTRDLANKVFARIAAYRQEYPSSYTNEMPNVDAKIDSILKRASTTQK